MLVLLLSGCLVMMVADMLSKLRIGSSTFMTDGVAIKGVLHDTITGYRIVSFRMLPKICVASIT